MFTFSFDVGGVVEHRPKEFGILMADLAKRHRIIIVSAIGHGNPERWGDNEIDRLWKTVARLNKVGLMCGVHWHAAYTTADPDSGHKTGKYKNAVIKREQACLHVDDLKPVLEKVSCLPVHYDCKEAWPAFESKFRKAMDKVGAV